MKILIVNWSWYPSGGDWTYIENLLKLYRSKGIEPIAFSTIHERNVADPNSGFFVEHQNYSNLKDEKTLRNSLKVMKSSIDKN